MEKQNYNNHVRWYKPHHFIFYPLIFGLVLASAFLSWNDSQNKLIWIFIGIILILTGALSLMLRQHYALTIQNRIVRLELRFRYYVITHKRFEEIEKVLSKSQIYALRFASDEELPALTERALKENLSGDEIKRSIKNWLPDEMRV